MSSRVPQVGTPTAPVALGKQVLAPTQAHTLLRPQVGASTSPRPGKLEAGLPPKGSVLPFTTQPLLASLATHAASPGVSDSLGNGRRVCQQPFSLGPGLGPLGPCLLQEQAGTFWES